MEMPTEVGRMLELPQEQRLYPKTSATAMTMQKVEKGIRMNFLCLTLPKKTSALLFSNFSFVRNIFVLITFSPINGHRMRLHLCHGGIASDVTTGWGI